MNQPDPTADRLDDLRAEYANTGMVTSDGAVWLFSQIVVLRERLADYENRITWHTTCESCARILDSSIQATEQTEAYRLALSEALGLGTGAPWDAIQERAAELAAPAAPVVPPAPTSRAAEAVLTRVREWVTSDVVTARSEFGSGYREAQRDISDLLPAAPPAVVPQPEEA